jgi:hypothetical protein
MKKELHVMKAAKALSQQWTKPTKIIPVGTTAEFSIIYDGEEYIVTLRHKPIWDMK